MRKHRKSRLGCKECKEKKVKCDETRPSCIKCRTAGRSCSYLEMRSNLPNPPITSQASTTTSPGSYLTVDSSNYSHSPNPPTPLPDSTASTSSFVPPVRSDAVFNECYSLFHLDLLHHFQGPLTNVTVPIQSELARILRVTYTEALRAPYLMDEVLAFASAHKSTVAQDSDSKALYQNESTRLQTRAISQLSLTNEDVNEDNFLPLFAFSLLLGQHVLFDVFSNPTSLTSVIDRFVQFLGLHHGISMITSQSIDRFTGLLQDLVPTDPVHFQVKVASLGRGTECQGLLQRLSESDLSESTKSVYADAVKILQYLFDTLESSDSRRYVAVQEWPVRISQDYISLLQQRRPEALVIMGYYAVLLHRAKDYWPVGDSGRFLIKVISNHLGSYWSDLLEWPNQELGLDET